MTSKEFQELIEANPDLDFMVSNTKLNRCWKIDPAKIDDLTVEELLELFEKDPGTDLVVVLGEVGGIQEQNAAEFIDRWMTKPVVAYIAGRNAPEGKRMGHAGAIIQSGMDTPQSKVTALRQVGVEVAEYPLEVVELVRRRLIPH